MGGVGVAASGAEGSKTEVVRKRWASASKLDRGEKCPTSLSPALPDVYEPAGKSAIWGKAIHSWAENNGKLGEPDREQVNGVWQAGTWPKWAVDGVTKKAWVSGVKPEDIYPPGGAVEMQAYLDGEDFRQAVVIVDKKWPALSSSLVMKVDYWGTKAGEPWIKDLKTGRIPPPPTSLQVAVGALVAMDITGPSADGVHTSIDHWPRYPLDGKPVSEWHYFERVELEDVRQRLVQLRKTSTGPNPPTNPGDWCRYCPKLLACPKRFEAEAAIEDSKFSYNRR